MHKVQQRRQVHLLPVDLTSVRPNRQVHFGDRVMLYHEESEFCLNVSCMLIAVGVCLLCAVVLL